MPILQIFRVCITFQRTTGRSAMCTKKKSTQVLLVSLFLLTTTAHGVPIDDSFDGKALDWCRWEDISYFGTVSQDGELTLSPSGSATYTIARLLSQARLVGDFDIQVDYRLGAGFNDPVTGSGDPAFNVTLGLTWDDPHIINLSRTHNSRGDGVSAYASLPELAQNNYLFSSASAQAGTLRMVRATDQLRYLHRPLGSTDWTAVGEMNVPATPVNVTLTAYNVDIARGFTAYLDNLKLNAGMTDDINYAQPTFFYKRADFALGGVSENWPAMKYFANRFATFDPLTAFRAQGMEWMRVGVTTLSVPELDAMPPESWSTFPWQSSLWGSREYAAVTLRDAQARGMRLYAYLYFSDSAANWGNQPAPAAWVGKSVAETATLVEQHAFDTATYFKNKGLNVEIYELGNEIDIGMIDFLPGRRIVVPASIDFVNDRKWLRENVWSIQATLLKAGIAGIRRANPSARAAIHAASLEVGSGSQFGPDFFQAMRDFGVDYDIAALSHPYATVDRAWKLDRYSTACWFKRVSRAVGQTAVPGKPVMIVEASYQSDPATLVSKPMQDFPFTQQGQADWLREQLRFASNHPSIVGWFYFYPEFYFGWAPITDAAYVLGFSSLLASETTPRPALAEFRVNLAVPTSVAEFYNTNLDHYFITADANEAAQIDNGSAGPGWSRTGNTFKSGGDTSVCRFYGSYSPGPNSHFYTVDPAECQGLKDQQIPAGDPRKLTDKSWNLESLDFVSTVPTTGGLNGTCPSGTTPVYRAYNNGFARGVDSNHRITSNLTAIQEVVTRGWSDEGVVMCAPI